MWGGRLTNYSLRIPTLKENHGTPKTNVEPTKENLLGRGHMFTVNQLCGSVILLGGVYDL